MHVAMHRPDMHSCHTMKIYLSGNLDLLLRLLYAPSP